MDALGQRLHFCKSLLGNIHTSQRQVLYFAVEFEIAIDDQIVSLGPAFCSVDVAARQIDSGLVCGCVPGGSWRETFIDLDRVSKEMVIAVPTPFSIQGNNEEIAAF
jgi:hypothetical protein